MKKKLRELKTIQGKAMPGGAVKAPFRCSLQAHLTRRINDAYSLIDENLGTGGVHDFSAGAATTEEEAHVSAQTKSAEVRSLGETGGGIEGLNVSKRGRRMSTVLRQSHWI